MQVKEIIRKRNTANNSDSVHHAAMKAGKRDVVDEIFSEIINLSVYQEKEKDIEEDFAEDPEIHRVKK
jgi:hypothetical protein